MTFEFFPHKAIDGSWHTVYRIPGTDGLQSVMDGLTESAAQGEADRLNRERAREGQANAAHLIPPHLRGPAKGFYTDKDAG